MSGPVNVLALMDYMIGQESRLVGLYEARAAVAELIEAIDAERKGEYHDSEVEFRVNYDARRYQEKKRVDAALARLKGE